MIMIGGPKSTQNKAENSIMGPELSVGLLLSYR